MRRLAGLAGAGLLLLAACGDDDDDADATTTTTEVETTTTTEPADTTTTTAAESDLLALFPADDVEPTPEGAAAGFMARYFPDASVTLGEFAEGDGESGEIEILGGGEGGGAALLRSTLLLRQVDEGWFVIAAVNPNVAITSPEAQSAVGVGQPLTIEGVGRGFEASIHVRVEAIDGSAAFDALGAGGSGETPEPFSVEVEIPGTVQPGTTLAIIAQGGTGLEDDPGEFSAVPVVAAIVD
jgi:hypothetical protein